MGTRGVGAVQGAVMRAVGLGGVSHDVVRQSRVPVTVVPITAPVPEMIAVRDGG
jgi:nucleotide-binding universal stress UspA family protein